MTVLVAERRSPFQTQPRENPFRRVLPAVVEMRDRVTASVRGIAERIHRSHTQDAVQLERARAIIENAIPQSSSRRPVTGMEGSLDRVYGERSRTTQDDTRDRMEANSNHQGKAAKALGFAADAGKYLMTHKLDTVKAVGRLGVKIAPTVATAVAVNIAAGALAAPVIAARAVGSGLNDVRRTVGSIKGKNIFATSETLRHGFAAVARSTPTESPEASGAPTLLQRIAQSPIGKVLSGYAHIEQNVAAQVVAHNAHISTIREFGLGKSRAQIESLVSTMSSEEMFTLRKHAVMARLTTDPKDTLRSVIHNIHRATSLRSAQLKKTATQSPDSAALPQYIALERQFKRGAFAAYRRRVREATGAHLGANLVKTIGTSLAFFYGGHLFGLHSANPFEHSTFWSNIADKAKELVHRGGARVEDGITQLLNASTPHAEAAELTLSEHLASHDTPVLPVTHLGQAINGTHTVAPEAVLPPAAPQKIVEIQKAQQEALQELRDLRDHAPMVPRVSGSVFTSQPVVVTPSTVTEVRAVLTSVSEMHTAGGTIQVDGTSLSQTLWNMRGTTTVAQSLPWLAQAKTLTEAYTSPDSAHAMWEHVILPSKDKITTEGFSRLQALFERPENAHASFAQVWKQYHALYDDHFAGLDTWGYEDNAQTVTLAVDHADTVGFADGSASATHAARMSIPEHETLPGGPKVLARLARRGMGSDTTPPAVVLKPHAGTGSLDAKYQVVNPPRGAGTTSVVSGTPYQSVPPPGGKLPTGSSTVGGYEVVAPPRGGSTLTKAGLDGSTVPPSMTPPTPPTRSVINGYQVVPPPSESSRAVSSGTSAYQAVGLPSRVDGHTPASSIYETVPPPTPATEPVYQEVPVPRYETDPSIVPSGSGSLETSFPSDPPLFFGGNPEINGRIELDLGGIGVAEPARFGQAVFNMPQGSYTIKDADTLLDCVQTPGGSPLCLGHSGFFNWKESGVTTTYHLPFNGLRENIQGDQDTFRSLPQIQGYFGKLAREGQYLQVNVNGSPNSLYVINGGTTMSYEEYSNPLSDPISSLSEPGNDLYGACLHSQYKAWEIFKQVFESHNSPDTNVQDAYKLYFNGDATLEQIDRAVSVIKAYLKNTDPTKYKEFLRLYRVAGADDAVAQSQAGGFVIKLRRVGGQ